MGKNGNGRLAWADLLRCAALFAVVLLHVSGARLADVPVDSGAFQVLNVYDGLTHWCVPVFVMLSGAFLLDPKHSLPLPKLLFRHILRIFTALAVWGAVYAVANHLEQGGAWTCPGCGKPFAGPAGAHPLSFVVFVYDPRPVSGHAGAAASSGRPAGGLSLVFSAGVCV